MGEVSGSDVCYFACHVRCRICRRDRRRQIALHHGGAGHAIPHGADHDRDEFPDPMFAILLATYVAVFAAEIVGDKLLYTTGVLATRYRTAPIMIGMAIAFMLKMGRSEEH